MNKNLIELAKILKERENPSIQGISVGNVVNGPPNLKITVNGFVLDASRLVVAKHLLHEYTTSLTEIESHGYHDHSLSDPLKIGDRVIIIPSTDNMTYYVIAKAGDL